LINKAPNIAISANLILIWLKTVHNCHGGPLHWSRLPIKTAKSKLYYASSHYSAQSTAKSSSKSKALPKVECKLTGTISIRQFRSISPARKTTLSLEEKLGKSLMATIPKSEFIEVGFYPLAMSFLSLQKLSKYRKVSTYIDISNNS
jgi:hypothetical protein